MYECVCCIWVKPSVTRRRLSDSGQSEDTLEDFRTRVHKEEIMKCVIISNHKSVPIFEKSLAAPFSQIKLLHQTNNLKQMTHGKQNPLIKSWIRFFWSSTFMVQEGKEGERRRVFTVGRKQMWLLCWSRHLPTVHHTSSVQMKVAAFSFTCFCCCTLTVAPLWVQLVI